MNGSGLKWVALGCVLLAVLLGMFAWRATIKATEAARQEAVAAAMAQVPVQEPRALAVIAMRPLPANQPVTADAVAVKSVSVVPDRYYTSVEDVVGRVPLLDIDTGAPVTPRYFKDANLLARLIPDKHRGISIEVSDVVAVGGFVRPGDRVDLLLYLRDGEEKQQSRILLRDILVLAYEERIIDRPDGLAEADGGTRGQRGRVRTAVVAIHETDVTRVMLGASVGDIRLALRRQEPDLAARDSTLPAVAATPQPELEREQVVTLAELSRVRKPTPTPNPAAPPSGFQVDVIRGTSQSQERTR